MADAAYLARLHAACFLPDEPAGTDCRSEVMTSVTDTTMSANLRQAIARQRQILAAGCHRR